MKMLVTGGYGFIGSNFIRYMLKKYSNCQIVNLDALTYASNVKNLKEYENHSNYTFVKGDIRDSFLVNRIFQQGIDFCVNFAAESHVDRSIQNPTIFIETNVNGTQVLLEAAKKYGINKFVQISTDEVYGSLGDTGLFTEYTPLSPNSPYSASKAAGDLLIRAYHETYGLPINITRCSNNYGPNQYPEKLIPLIISKAIQDKPLPIYGNGLNVRDWLFVKDHCTAIDLVIHNGKSGEVYNIGGRSEKTNINIVRMILQELGKPESLISYVKDRPGHDYRYGIDATKIKQELGWKPKYDFETGIKKTIKWYLNNQEWLNKEKYNKMTINICEG
ncbi:dTDP-glucose 4,6-dehydratase [Paenibacillus sp. J2TS4]|uniref:dTDP-glucose 4,6-dehydratase n=1 Tax=Paenibacillus sp. J2TS4 TaxID=2807194 RepID=UPI001B212015|nr:dTDP-glucose 4,6-dehydratase [Paenibacillus sp. J2TS4]GIP35113.1 dTDP-glucose 4,6-dehydratase [Paenibacillus sp. J2TS4]